ATTADQPAAIASGPAGPADGVDAIAESTGATVTAATDQRTTVTPGTPVASGGNTSSTEPSVTTAGPEQTAEQPAVPTGTTSPAHTAA
ncbi:hypothetical protein, partial [Mycobacterium marinum]|uniref:hypothetical protein n=1 Tax=Mycobacterium marinum TaxID=1781 RepID=UPI0035694A06